MSLLTTLRFILTHPLNRRRPGRALFRFLRWQIEARLNPGLLVRPFAEKSRLYVRKGLTGATGNLYCGLHEFEDMAFVLHFLRPGDLFVDVGANVGSYTILAAKEAGAGVLAVEPIPRTFELLKQNIALNGITEQVDARNIGLGDHAGELSFTENLDTVNHVAAAAEPGTIVVPVRKFDDLVAPDRPTLVKIDVEGYETAVLNGMENALRHPFLAAIIIELNGSGARYGYNDDVLHERLTAHGFRPFGYHPFERRLEPLTTYGTHNTLYVRDIALAEQRVAEARQFLILGQGV